MKTIYDRLNKVYDKTLLDQKDIRKHYRTICLSLIHICSARVSCKILMKDLNQRLEEIRTALSPSFDTVSYTHLDVYKRQALRC